ncbi:MAG: PAS domain S-box protein [Chloroflexota bacterium]|nr:PAS domain S-box protein [Chloroflexota bacterium]
MAPSLSHAIMASSPDAILIINDHGKVQDANPLACQLLGYARNDLVQRHGDELAPADATWMAKARAAYAAQGSWRAEIGLARKDGTLVSLEAWLLLIPASGGSLAAVFLRTKSKPARMSAQAEQWASDSRYRSLVEQLPVAVYILAADENQTPVYFSPYIEALTGETPAEAMALQHHWLQLVHPEDRERVAAEDARTTASGAIFRIEYRHVRKDGSYVWVRDECVPIRDEAGQIMAWQGLMLDISERMRLEAVAGETRIREEQRDQLRIILDHLPAGVLILRGSDGQIEQANATAMEMIFGPAAAREVLPVYGRDFRFLRVDGTPLTLEQRLGMRALYGKVVGHEHLLLERQDGRLVPVLAHAARLPETSGELSRAVLVQQDVTRLREAEQLKDDFLALVSHEFRTPLTTIHGGAHLLLKQRTALNEETQNELLSDIVTESERLDHILANILNLAAVMAGRLEVSTEPVLLAPFVGQVVSAIARQFPHHALRVAIPRGLPAVEGDPALLTEVLTNLYENAAKYSPPGSTIVTTAYPAGARIALDVTDRGIGIPADQLERIFTRFHRVDPASPVRGTGLGLYLSRALIEAQGGCLVARSDGRGAGATFTITLPIVDNESSSG